MEETSETKKSYKKITIIQYVIFILSILGLSYGLYLTHSETKDKETELNDTRTCLEEERSNKTFYKVLTDSLKKQNTNLSQFKTLTMAMVHRNDATSQLKHKVGDVTYMKNDSAKVVIEDVLIGGGEYNYYVKFRVLYKDQSTKEVVPELIY